MRRSTFLLTMLGIVLYLTGMLYGLADPWKDLQPEAIPNSVDLYAEAVRLEPNHAMVIETLNNPKLIASGETDWAIRLAKEYLANGQANEATELLINTTRYSDPDPQVIQLLSRIYHFNQQYQQEQEFLVSLVPDQNDLWITRRLILLNAVLGIPNSNAWIEYAPIGPNDPYAQILNAARIEEPIDKVQIIVANLIQLGETRLALYWIETVSDVNTLEINQLPMLPYLYAVNGNTPKAKALLNDQWGGDPLLLPNADAALIATSYELIGDSESALNIYTRKLAAELSNDAWRRNKLRLAGPLQPASAAEEYIRMIQPAPSIENLSAFINFCIDFPAYRDPNGDIAAKTLASEDQLDPAVVLLLARYDFSGGEHEGAIELLNGLIESGPDENLITQARYLRAIVLLATQTSPSLTAADDLLAVIHHYPPSPLAQNAEQLFRSNFRDVIR